MNISGTQANDRTKAGDTKISTVEITFITNRQHVNSKKVAERFGEKIGPLSFGTCSVEFEPIEMLKKMAQNISIRIPTEDEEITELRVLDEDKFWAGIQQRIGGKNKKVVFYTHGYKMDFDKACRRAALMQRQLGSDILVVLFAWPSQDNMAMYARDETLLKKSVKDITKVLDGLLMTTGHGQVDVVGHSLGTRGVTKAITKLESQNKVLIDEVVLVAPDMDRHDFEEVLPQLSRVATGITIYVSDADGPLRASREMHGEPRIGEAGEHLSLFESVETIDISELPQSDITGHNYHYFNNRVIEDLRQLFFKGARASQRSGLEESTRDGKPYWRMLK